MTTWIIILKVSIIKIDIIKIIIILIIILKNTKGFSGAMGQKSTEKVDRNTHDTSATAEPRRTASALLFKCFFQHLGVPREELQDMTEELSLQTVH